MAPWLATLPAGNPDLLSLLPVVDINGAAFAAFEAVEPDHWPAGAAAALLLADPFLRPRDAAARLRRAGLGGVANFPTTQLVDGSTALVFESAGMRAARERALLAALAGEGFATMAFACGIEAARDFARAQPTLLVLHPGVALSDWRQRAAAALATSRAIEEARAETRCPILVYRPRGFGQELAQALAAADGEAAIV